MTPQGWTALAATGAFGALALAMIVHAIHFAYKQGRTDHRLESLESQQAGSGNLHTLVAALTATVDGLKDAVKRLDAAVEGINSRTRRKPTESDG
jgi:hypothetical protein